MLAKRFFKVFVNGICLEEVRERKRAPRGMERAYQDMPEVTNQVVDACRGLESAAGLVSGPF